MAKQKNSAIKNILQQLILDAFSEQMHQNFNYKQIASKLNVEDLVTRQLILEIIEEMAEKGTIKEVAKGKYQLKELQNHVIGKIDMAQNGSAYLIVEGMEEDVFISPRKLRNALHGDQVKVFMYAKRNGKNLEGEVLEILERAKMEFTGIIQLTPKFAFLVPDNKKMNHDIFIPFDQNLPNRIEKANPNVVLHLQEAEGK